MDRDGSDVELPSSDDEVGQRYVRDANGRIVLDRRGDHALLRNFLVFGLIGLLGITTLLSIALLVKQDHQADVDRLEVARQSYATRLSQREGCEKSGNSLRRDVRGEFVDLKRRVLIPVFHEIALTIPIGEPSRAILDGAVVTLYHRIATIKQRIPNAPCHKLYPLLDNPDTSQDETGT